MGTITRDYPKLQTNEEERIMTVLAEPEDFYPVALRKIFYGEITGPLELTEKEVKDAQAWKRQLDLDIIEIDLELDKGL